MFACKLIIQMPRRRRLLAGLTVLGLVSLLCAAFFAFRNPILHRLVDQKIGRYLSQHPTLKVRVGQVKFIGLSGIRIKKVQLQTSDRKLEASLGSCSLELTLGDILRRRFFPRQLEIDDLFIRLRQPMPAPIARPETGHDPAAALKPDPGSDYARQAASLVDLFFQRIPAALTVTRLTIVSENGSAAQIYHLPGLTIRGPTFEAPLQLNDGEQSCNWLVRGSLDRKSRRFALHLFPAPPGGRIRLPYIGRRWGLKTSFTSASLALQFENYRQDALNCSGSLAVADLSLNHPRIAAQDVDIPQAGLDFQLRIGRDDFELSPSSRIRFNQLVFSPHIRFRPRPGPELSLNIDEPKIQADDFFNSLPAGLFTRLAGIRTSGQLAFHLHLAIDLRRPEELLLESSLEQRDFTVKQFGAVDFRGVNQAFTYEAFVKDQWVRSVRVGPDNPDFRALDRISPFLRNAVLICEDGAFFRHRGFLLEPFKDSIVANLKAGRFVRGGSTISMQLVKNLFLNQHKTIARKLEEMIITWLIEEKQLIGKERMFEIYLNIIEWGPGVYGAAEASRYYFAKDPAELTLAESIFLASIVPRPRRFMVAFDLEQNFKEWMLPFYRDVSAKMLQRNMIAQSDFDSLLPRVRLTGPARLLLKGSPSQEADEEGPFPFEMPL